MRDLGKQDEAGVRRLCILGGEKQKRIFSCNLDFIWGHVGAKVAQVEKIILQKNFPLFQVLLLKQDPTQKNIK